MRVNKLTYKDINWDWDWGFEGATALCNFCHDTDGGHSGACGCVMQSKRKVKHDNLPCIKGGFWEAVKESEKRDLRPKKPTEAMIHKYLDWIRDKYATHEGEWLFGPPLTEKTFFEIKKYAALQDIKIPTFEELCAEVGQEPVYDCKTGAEFQKEVEEGGREILILSYAGWGKNKEAFETERITWPEFCRRRNKCECDYSNYTNRGKYDQCIIGDAEKGDRLVIGSGSLYQKTVTVIENKWDDYAEVLIDDTKRIVVAQKTNLAYRIHPTQVYINKILSCGYERQGDILTKQTEHGEALIDMRSKFRYMPEHKNKIDYSECTLVDMLKNIASHVHYER